MTQNIHNTIEVPRSSRLFFCTDVHGRLDALEQLLGEAGFTQDDYLVSLGDSHDRGPKSLETLNFFLNPKYRNVFSLVGNHEQMLIEKDLHNLFYNGGQWVAELGDETLDYLSRKVKENFYYAFTVEKDGYKLGCVHAEVPVEYNGWGDFLKYLIRPQVRNEALWGRDMIYRDKTLQGVNFVLHGHTPMPETLRAENRVYFDTGKTLTLLEFVDGAFKEYQNEF